MEQVLQKLIEMAIGNRSRNEFCKEANISPGNFSRIMRGQRPTPDILDRIAEASAGRVSYQTLMEAAGYIEAEEGKLESPQIPIYGSAAAGSPIEAIENYAGFIKLAYDGRTVGDNCFALRVVGDSMNNANIPDGSIVVIERKAEIKDGDIGAVMVNGEATIKRIYDHETHLVLAPVSSNPIYEPQVYFPGDDIEILGKVVLSLIDVG